jgi:riboflavin transporter FmnP
MVVLLRVGALAFVLTGFIGAITWAVAFRRTGFDGLVAGILVGTLFAAGLMTGIAYVMDLLAFIKRNESVRA